MVILGLLGMASTGGLNAFAHSITFGINLAVFTNLAQYMYSDTKRRRQNIEPAWRRWGPFWCIILATIGVMADLTRHLINDSNNWYLTNPEDPNQRARFDFDNCVYGVPVVLGNDQCQSAGSGPFVVAEENALGLDMSMYNDDGSLSFYGWTFTIIGTWTGFGFLFIGVLWYTNIGEKMRRQYLALRGGIVRNEEAQEAFLSPTSTRRDDGFITPLSQIESPA